ncbi:metallophosphoesterase family protein [uncultured Desulfosarcina sp.]|uniref:metallophosphoesterase family protein n=1 Tax=uncultured Desulfosarcina sp. TaxID=218289 RepID=UPI0029C6B258|nr:metallophosphoesterase family protein [uncultured Desulfosarcina sp.]
MLEKTNEKIGIMADSHGNPEAIACGAVFLRQRACTSLYHLGDICDSTLPKTADDCVVQVKNHGIVAVKGNNDHTLAADAWGRSDRGIRRETIAFLENLPLCLSVGSAKLAHSRPFVRRLGLSAIIGAMGQREAADFFRQNPDGLLFRGHSHKPEIISRRGKEIRFFSPAAGLVIELADHRPCIVTCGALTSGFVMIWEPGSDRLTFCTFT